MRNFYIIDTYENFIKIMVHGSDRVKKYFARFGLSWNNFQSGHGLKMMGILSSYAHQMHFIS